MIPAKDREKLDEIEALSCNLLVGLALGRNVDSLVADLKKKIAAAKAERITKAEIASALKRAEAQMAPGLKRFTNVDVSQPATLYENPSKIPLSKGRYALVDLDDARRLGKYSWYYGFRGYAMRSKKMPSGTRKTVSMHREILGAKDHEEVDHINGDRLDNRRSNLRVLGRSANLHNRGAYGPSGLKGVSWDKRKQKWRAEIGKNGKRAWLGYHNTKAEAEVEYRKASKKLYTGKDRAAR